MSCANPSKCDRDRRKNVWVEGNVNDDTGEGGICLLDTLTEDEIVHAIERSEVARGDLVKVTSDPFLLSLAAGVARLPTGEPADEEMRKFRPPPPPFYALFQGKL